MYAWVDALPSWLLYGLALGGVLSLLVAAAFAVGARAFPDRVVAAGPDGGETRRRAEIRRYLREIGEPFGEDHEVAGHTVAFYLPRRNVAITFDARTYFLLEREEVHAILVEYELPGAGVGHRLPFETPEPAPPDGGSDTAFATLGLPPSATSDEVRAAYRDRVKEVHPDHGGDPEAFRRLREAYAAARERAG